MAPSDTMKANSQGDLKSVPALGPLGPVSEGHGFFSNRDYFGGELTKSNCLSCSGSRLDNLDNSRDRFSCLMSAFCWSVALGGRIVSPDGKFSLKLFVH